MLEDRISALNDELGISSAYLTERGLPRFDEAEGLVEVGQNLLGRMQQLTPRAAQVWQDMREKAESDGVTLMLVSGFRGIDYQAALIKKKLDAGQDIENILLVSAPPGFSQHHTGEALDLATPGSRPLTEDFELTDAYRWLAENAETCGFSMTYPRDNAYGFAYEPWHWALQAV